MLVTPPGRQWRRMRNANLLVVQRGQSPIPHGLLDLLPQLSRSKPATAESAVPEFLSIAESVSSDEQAIFDHTTLLVQQTNGFC
jgi:hypothetical protein